MRNGSIAVVVSSVLVLALSACTVDATTKMADDKGGPTSDREGVDPRKSDDVVVPRPNESSQLPEPDAIVTRPEDRLPPSAGGSVRDCKTKETEAKPLRDYFTWVSSKPISLGTGLDAQGVPDAASQWVTGSPSYSAETGPLGFTSKQGWDLSANDRKSVAQFEKTTMLTTTSSGKNGFDVWAAALPPSATRLTVSRIDFVKDVGLAHFAEPRPTAYAPTTGKYVSALRGKAFAGYTFAIEVEDECEMGAISDVLGTRATLEALAAKASDPKLREVLVRSGAVVSVAVISNRPQPGIQAVIEKSTCSAAAPPACKELFEALDSWVEDWRNVAPAKTYETISSAKDAFWSYPDFLSASIPR